MPLTKNQQSSVLVTSVANDSNRMFKFEFASAKTVSSLESADSKNTVGYILNRHKNGVLKVKNYNLYAKHQ